ncbi:MAG: SCO family protein [Pseudomonadota bacterium]
MNKIAIFGGGAVLLAAVGVGAWMAFPRDSADRFAGCSETNAMSASIGGPFTLVDETGRTVTDQDVFTEPSVIYFGYTFCPDVCPLDNWRNAEAATLLEGEGVSMQPVFISVDPQRDTPEVVADFTDVFHPRMLGLTGSPEQVDAASKAYRTYYRAHDAEEDEFYLVDHSTYSYLVLPEYGFVEFFRRDVSAEEMAERVACFVEQA